MSGPTLAGSGTHAGCHHIPASWLLLLALAVCPAAADAGARESCLDTSVRWLPVGARIAYTEENRLEPCRDFSHVRDAGTGEKRCRTEIAPDRARAVNELLKAPRPFVIVSGVPARVPALTDATSPSRRRHVWMKGSSPSTPAANE